MVNWGLIHSRYVIVVISKNFLNKNWPNREFNSVLNQESSTGEIRILPLIVEHKSDPVSPQTAYPLLGDKKYLVWKGSTEAIVEELKKLFPSTPQGNDSRNVKPTEEEAKYALNKKLERPTVLIKESIIESLTGSQTLGTFIQPSLIKNYSFDEIVSAFDNGRNDLFLTEEYLKVAIEKASQIIKETCDSQRIFLQLSSTFFRYSSESKSIFHSLIDAAGLKPDRFTLLFPEHSIPTSNLALAVGLTAELRHHGFEIGITNFGTGYSSLAYLRSLAINDLFIDRQFISSGEIGINHSIMLAMMSLCSTLGIRAVAEGVLSNQQKLFLQATGCEFIENLNSSPAI